MSSKRERVFLVVTVTVLGLFGLDSFVLTPLGRATSRLRAERETLEGDLLSSQNKLHKRKTLSRTWSVWIGSTLRKDPSEAERQILNAVRSWSRDAGITPASIQPERPTQRGDLREIRFQTSASGPFAALVRFLCYMEASEIPVRIQRLELRPAKGTSTEQLTLDLRFSTLYVAAERGKAEQLPARGTSGRDGSPAKEEKES
jgi:hypothetical protein